MKLRLVCIGRVSEPWLQQGVEEYTSRIRRYLPLEIVEMKEEPGGRKPDPRLLREGEGERLLAKIPAGAFVVGLEERGNAVASEALSALLGRHMVEGTSAMCWILGGPYGLSESVRQRSNLLLSLSPMTFTHQMARLILLEQLYRGLTILRNEPYHNR
ncbi:MAG: 23S rRNA (pseudouridine(1915)-N(3))-methyltransferase RlmH [Desulfuromonadales bacterium]|nr:23S rRNA (pseudouridine(1915)-N(3))-methyltransferase RlmH [Desulfuromonadales bacterium]